MNDNVTNLLRDVASGKVSVEDARAALEGVELTEDQVQSAVDHGVFNPAEPGTVVNASLAPSGGSALIVLLFAWGVFWVMYWMFGLLYGLFNGWDQQKLSYHFAMSLTTLIIMGVVYLKWVLPDRIIVKHRRPKFVPEHVKDWRDFEV